MILLSISLLLISIGSFGMAGAIFGSSIISIVYNLFGPRASKGTPSLATPRTLDILVAAHNEEACIEATLSSLEAAALKVAPATQTRILVGLDHCTDATADLVRSFAARCSLPVIAIENPGQAGKWWVLQLLFEQSTAEWIAYVDSGSIWHSDLLIAAERHLADPQVVGVAPSYMPQKSGRLEQLNWKLEQKLKTLENASGGPVSVHGATVLYRRFALHHAFEVLGGRLWFNDDVVIPLTLRTLSRDSRIVYLAGTPESTSAWHGGWVSDLGVRSELDVEYRRRRRMVAGNIQWIRSILIPRVLQTGAWGVAFVASRRVLRLFWAYWILCLGLGTALVFAWAAPLTFLVIGTIALVGGVSSWMGSSWVRRAGMAYVSGLEIALLWQSAELGQLSPVEAEAPGLKTDLKNGKNGKRGGIKWA